MDGILQATEWGTPQGSSLSPLLANIVLDELDRELERMATKADKNVLLETVAQTPHAHPKPPRIGN